MSESTTASSAAFLQKLLGSTAPSRSRTALQFEGVELPLIILNAREHGPVVWVEAAVHGDENDGTAACLRLAESLDGKLLRGSVVLVPAANPDAYRAGALGSPKDGRNLNRMGNADDDSFSVRWFAFLRDLVYSAADVFLDLHGGGRWLDVAPFAMTFKGHAPSLELAMKLDLDYVLENPSTANLISALSREGIPSILLESGSGSSIREEAVERHCRNVLRILSLHSMVETEDASFTAPKRLSVLEDLYFPQEGALVRFAPVGTHLAEGDRIVEYAAWPSLEPHVLASPLKDGVLLSVHSSSLIRKGAYAALIGAAEK